MIDLTKEIRAAAAERKSLSELSKILDKNEDIFEIVERLVEKIKEAMRMITEHVEILKNNVCKEASISQSLLYTVVSRIRRISGRIAVIFGIVFALSDQKE